MASRATSLHAAACDNPAIMIGRLSGILLEKNPPQLLLDVQGVGVRGRRADEHVLQPARRPASASRCSRTSSCARTRTCCSASARDSERRAFRQLLKISGVGARTRCRCCPGLSVAELAQAVTMQETGRLTKIPGIGKKTAERLLLELKDKLGADLTADGRRLPRAARVERHPARAARAGLQRQGGGRRRQETARRRSRSATASGRR